MTRSSIVAVLCAASLGTALDTGLRASASAEDCDAGCKANEGCRLHRAAPSLRIAGNCGALYESVSGIVATRDQRTRGFRAEELATYRAKLGLGVGMRGMVKGPLSRALR